MATLQRTVASFCSLVVLVGTDLFALAHLRARMLVGRPASVLNVGELVIYSETYAPWHGTVSKALADLATCDLSLRPVEILEATPFAERDLPPLELAWTRFSNSALRLKIAEKLVRCGTMEPEVVARLSADKTRARQAVRDIGVALEDSFQCRRPERAATRALLEQYMACLLYTSPSPRD